MYRRNITRLAIAIVILSFVLSTFVSLWSLRLMAKRNMQELSKSLASLIYDSISSELSEPIIVSRSMANDTLLIDALENEASNGMDQTAEILAGYLTAQKEAFGYEAAFLVSEASKCYYSYGGINKQMDLTRSDRDQWYPQFIATGKEYELDVDRDELSQDRWTVFVDTRIEDGDGKLLGVCGVGARMTGSQDLFVTLEKEYKVHISLIDADGLIHVDTDESRIESDYMTGIQVSDSKDFVYQKIGADRAVVTKYVDRLGWYLVIESDGSTERGELINVLVLNIVLCAIVLVIMLLAVRIIIARTRALTSASFIDQSTQLLNRRAFEEKKAELAQTGLKADFVYVTADLNGLKRVNDNLGHTAGDELIKGAADCLKECFSKYGDVYRIGGDEFAAMLRLSDEGLKEAMARLDSTTQRWSGQQVKSLSISCGSASCREFPSGNIDQLIRISDERMYAAKAAYYARTGIDRRR
ncbi:MAG: GGDEF domain-containing protein [Clostridia bacterium]|nr:GGDEF domain-containing protein [Clostridia bacterium]